MKNCCFDMIMVYRTSMHVVFVVLPLLYTYVLVHRKIPGLMKESIESWSGIDSIHSNIVWL